MQLVPQSSTLNALIPRVSPAAPKELLVYLATQRDFDTSEARAAAERELQTRLHLYGLFFEKDISAVPNSVKQELQRNRGACMALLVHLHCRAVSAGTVPDLIDEVVDYGLEHLESAARQFIIENLVWLLLSCNDERLIDTLEADATKLGLTDEQQRAVRIARIVASFSPTQIPSAISELIAIYSSNSKPDAASAAAYYLLAQIYGTLGLPCEEKEHYDQWRSALTRLHGMSPAHIAAKYSTFEPLFSRSIITGHYRWFQLLEAALETKAITETIAEFEAKGYTQEFARFREHSDRQEGYQCVRVSREQISDTNGIRQTIGDLLMNAIRSKACLIVKDESLGEIDEFSRSKSRNLESVLISGLQAEVSDLAFLVEQQPIEESAMGGRQWILCCELDNPISAIAIGILPTKTSLSLCYARAVAFDTRLTQEKGKNWVNETARLLGEQCDAQKLSKLRAAIKQILHKATAGRRGAKYTKVT